MNNKKAFTLIEMMVSIGIIVILSSVLTSSVASYVGKAQSASNGVDSHLNKYDAAKSSVNALSGVTAAPAAVVPGTYTVNFDPLGGSSVDSFTAVPENTTISAPAVPTWSGKSFVAWFKESACSTLWNFSSDKVTGNITLYAKWTASTPAKYIVTFDSKGGSAVGPINEVAVNTKISAPSAPTKTGNTFSGWYKDSSYGTAWNFGSDTVTGNVTLYAQWTPITTSLTAALTPGSTWGSGPYTSQYALAVNNTGATQISTWTVTITVPAGSTVSGWSATYSISGTTLTISPLDYNTNISAGGSVSGMGFQLSTPSSFSAKSPSATGS